MDSETQGIMELAKAQGYEVKGVKSFLGREGYGFNATMYRNGKRIAFVVDSADGGDYDWDWVDRKEEIILQTNVDTLPKVAIGCRKWQFGAGGDDLTIDIDWFISGLVEKFENDKAFRTKCKSKTLFILHSHQEGQYMIDPSPYTAGVKTKIESEYGADLKEIVNERFMKPVSEKESEDLYYRPKCRKATYFRLKDGHMMVAKQCFTSQTAKLIRDKYGEQLVEIINERY